MLQQKLEKCSFSIQKPSKALLFCSVDKGGAGTTKGGAGTTKDDKMSTWAREESSGTRLHVAPTAQNKAAAVGKTMERTFP